MFYNDGRIRVRRYAGERNLRACILQLHRGPTPSVMVWGAIEYNMRYRLLRTEGNVNSNRYIREILQPEVLPLLQATPHATFQQDNGRSHISGIWLVEDLFVRVLQHLLLTLCGLAYKRRGGTFPRMISRVCLIPCHDA